LVVKIADGICEVSGIRNPKTGAIVRINNKYNAIILSFNQSTCFCGVLDDCSLVKAGMPAKYYGKVAGIIPNFQHLGGIFDPVGNAISKFSIKKSKISEKSLIYLPRYRFFEKKAPGIIKRGPIKEPLVTGISIIDSIIPIGKGQRQLILGDRQTGKSSLAFDIILNQRNNNKWKSLDSLGNSRVFSIYVAIGQKKATTARFIHLLKKFNALWYTIVILTSPADSATMQYLAPYTGTTFGEFFRDNGLHALVILDDLSKHAVAYRQMALILRKPPGREAYPGDVFYAHARLLERASKISKKYNYGSLTSLPIIETLDCDVAAYIPTNVISITDGQIFLDARLFRRGVKPAINSGISVSRVGSNAQLKCLKSVSKGLKKELTYFRDVLEGSSPEDELGFTSTYQKGELLSSIFSQKNGQPTSPSFQIIFLNFLNSDVLSTEDTLNANEFKILFAKLFQFSKFCAFAEIIEKQQFQKNKLLLKLLVNYFKPLN